MGSFSVFFDGQFWIGVAERERAGAYEVARVVFGPSEPRDYELVDWAREEFHRLTFRAVDAAAAGDAAAPARNPKRAQREAARALATAPLSTRAQAAVTAAHALAVVERKQERRRRAEEEREQRWQLRRARRKKRKRGH